MNWATAFFAGDEHPDHHKPLDGLRGLAVLMVVFGHGANHGLGPFGPDSMMIRGKLGIATLIQALALGGEGFF
jgi:peptidoglycan/LPS O-acetylase OafA/YrhL